MEKFLESKPYKPYFSPMSPIGPLYPNSHISTVMSATACRISQMRSRFDREEATDVPYLILPNIFPRNDFYTARHEL
jgi:hypothetical protein